jgi:hypothetical protein
MVIKKLKHIVNPPLPEWNVTIEFSASKFGVLQLLEYIVKLESSDSGTFLPLMLADARWYGNRVRMQRVYTTLCKCCKQSRFAPYMKVWISDSHRRVVNDFKIGILKRGGKKA